MKKIARLLIFVMAFQMEVRVRASEGLIQQPEACLHQKGSCIVQGPAEDFVVEKKDVTMRAPAQTVLERKTDQEWRLMQGTVWIEKGHNVSVETVFGEVRSKDGEFWIFERDGKIWVRNISADLNVRLRDGKDLSLPAGFEFWMGGINTHSQSAFGVLQPISLKDHLKQWAQLYPGTKEAFKKEVQEFKENWKTLADKGGNIYQGITDRRIASIKEEKRQIQLRKDREEAEKKRVKDLYFQKVFER